MENNLVFKNSELEEIVSFVQSLKIKGAKLNRSRFRLVKLIQAKRQELEEERLELAKDYANLDDKGNAVIIDGRIDIIEDKQLDFNREQVELYKEDAVIDLDEHRQSLQQFYGFLNEYDEELDGADAMIFGRLLDCLEAADLDKMEEN